MSRSRAHWCIAVAAMLLTGGCYTTTIRSGAAPGRTPVGYDEHWHDGFWWGLSEAEGPYDVNRICPEGWAEVTTEVDFPTGLLAAFTMGVYYPQRVTLVCAAGAPRAPQGLTQPALPPPPGPPAAPEPPPPPRAPDTSPAAPAPRAPQSAPPDGGHVPAPAGQPAPTPPPMGEAPASGSY